MKLALVISSLGGGGGERIMLDLARGWIDRGHAVTIVTLSTPESDAYPVPDGAARVALDCMGDRGGRLAAPFRLLQRVRRIRGALRAVQADVVIGFMVPTTVLALLAARDLGCPVMVYELVDPAMERVPPPYGWLRRRLYPGASAVLAQTPRAQASLERIAPGSRVRVAPGFVPPFVLAQRREMLPEGAPSFLAVGRLAHQKGFDMLLRAFARIAAEIPDWSLRVLGSGPLGDALAAQTTALGLGDRVTWIPRHPAPWSFATRPGVFVLSSRYEGFPNVLLEAMAVGLPPVAFDCPSGPGEIIRHGQNGVLVPCGDVDRLAVAMQEMALAPEVREQIAAAAWSDVRRHWSLERTLEAWDAIFREAGAPVGLAPVP